MAEIVLINPRFEASYWGMEYALPLLGKKANLPVACLPLLAALTPAEHRVTLIDENVTELDFGQIARADMVGVTGMSVQRFRMREVLQTLKSHGVFTVVGGPWVTVKPEYFGDLADVVFVGEAEETWPLFLDQWQRGIHESRYEQAERTDMTRVPCPRYDLLDVSQYMFSSLQISRGCPFQCEFCDIIVTFGRRPRLKTSAQVIAELDAMYAQKMRTAFIVDDNLIGNKRAIRPILQEIVDWQKSKGYPFIFFTQASIDLADDPDLLELLVEANIQTVFIGVESPNAESLRETQKFQNLRSGGSLVEKIHRVQAAGIEVWTGMIVGFDNDDEAIFESQAQFIEQARVAHAMLGMLSAIPKTPLYDRLMAEGRLDLDDAPEFGTNVIPRGMTREALRDGYMEVLKDLYEPAAYFDRIDSLFHDPSFRFNRAQHAYWRNHRVAWLQEQAKILVRCAVLYRRLMRQVSQADLRQEYRRRLRGMWRQRRDPAIQFVYLLKCILHYHYVGLSANLIPQDRAMINTI